MMWPHPRHANSYLSHSRSCAMASEKFSWCAEPTTVTGSCPARGSKSGSPPRQPWCVTFAGTITKVEKGKPNSLYGPNGTALIIHAGKDDYKSDPTGEAGGRNGCGVAG